MVESKFAGIVRASKPQAEAAEERVEKIAPAAPATPPAAAPVAEPRTAMTYRPTIRNHDRLRKISFDTRRSMQDLVDEAVDGWLNRHS